MSQYKVFQGKTLDDAISEACDYFGVPREKLEIEIMNDAKTGIFGLVGVKKAEIRAARAPGAEAVATLADKAEESPPQGARPGRGASSTGARKDKRGMDKPEKALAAGSPREASAQTENRNKKNAPQKGVNRPPETVSETGKASETPPQPSSIDASPPERHAGGDEIYDSPDLLREDLPEFDLEACDREELFRVVESVVLRLVDPIVGPAPCQVEISGKRVRAVLDCGDASGLLVGRDGQTLAAVQYLATRIVARRLGGAVRLHIDAGRYRERQDDKLREMALALAAKARESGRSQATRPLSAYQRRIVHLALESDEGVTTRSKGEGAQRRVVVHPRRDRQTERPGAHRPHGGEPADMA